MRVVVNQWTVAGRKTGVGQYTFQLLRCLREQAGEDLIDPYPSGWLWHAQRGWMSVAPFLRSLQTSPTLRRWPVLGAPGLLPRALLRRAYHFARRARDRRFREVFDGREYDLYHEPNFIPHPSSLPTVTTVHDLSVLLYPQWHPPARVAYFEREFERGLRQTDHVLTVSELVRRQVIRELRLPPERVTCTYNGVRPDMAPLPPEQTASVLRRLRLPAGYLLHVGTIEPRKNLLTLMRAYCALPAALRERCPLLLVGSWGWRTEALAEFYHGEARHRGVRHLGYVDDRDLPALYNGARALAYPSHYEGFGLPPVEMMACGGAVLASTAEVFRETVGGRAHLIAPEDTDGWRAALARVIEDDDWRAELCAGARQAAAAYTWERCAAETLRVYRTVCGLPLQAREAARHVA